MNTKRQRSPVAEKDKKETEKNSSNGGNYNDLTAAERSPLQIYLRDIGKYPLLTIEEEQSLARKVRRGNKQATEKMIRSNLRLVVKIAQDYNHFGLPYLDLISEGNIGLMKAIERFDPDRGGKLSTYAAWWIKQTIKRALANQGKTIRLPVHLVEKISRLRKVESQLAESLRRDPTNEEIGGVLNLPPGKVAHLKAVSVRPTSLETKIGKDENTELGELIGDESATTPSDEFLAKASIKDITDILDQLDERDSTIIRMRFGLGNERPKTLEDVGIALGITRERVRQLQYTILRQLRELLQEKDRQRNEDEIFEEKLERKRAEVFQEFFVQVHEERQEASEKKSAPKVNGAKKKKRKTS